MVWLEEATVLGNFSWGRVPVLGCQRHGPRESGCPEGWVWTGGGSKTGQPGLGCLGITSLGPQPCPVSLCVGAQRGSHVAPTFLAVPSLCRFLLIILCLATSQFVLFPLLAYWLQSL